MLEKIIGKYNITVEQFEELICERSEEEVARYHDRVENLEAVEKYYKECENKLNAANLEIDKIRSSHFLKNDDMKKIIDQQVANKRQLLNMDLLEEGLELAKSQMELLNKALEFIVDIVVNMKDNVLI